MKMLSSSQQTTRSTVSRRTSQVPKSSTQSEGAGFKRILVPIDFSAPSYRALAFAAQLAKEFGSLLTVAHVAEPFIYPTDWTHPHGTPEQQSNLTAQMQELLKRHGLRGEAILREGRVWLELVNLAKEQNCDLIVIATHGYTGMKRALLGSVAAKVVQHAPCPVLTLRGGRFSGGKSEGEKRASHHLAAH